jgi:hypothetical protein
MSDPDHTHTCDGYHEIDKYDHFCPGCKRWWYRRPRTTKTTNDVGTYKER